MRNGIRLRFWRHLLHIKERNVLTRLGASAWYPAGGGGVMAALWHF